MRKYQCDYYLKYKQYYLIKEYFDKYSVDELIDRNLFESHLTNVKLIFFEGLSISLHIT